MADCAAAILYPPSSILVFSELRETRPMHREKPHKLLQVGVTPTPATSLCRQWRRRLSRRSAEREDGPDQIEYAGYGSASQLLGKGSGCPTVNRGSQKMCRKRRTGALPAFPTSLPPRRRNERRLPRRSPPRAQAGFVICVCKLRRSEPFRSRS